MSLDKPLKSLDKPLTSLDKPLKSLDKPLKILGKPMHGFPWNPMHVLVPGFSWICFRMRPGFFPDFSGLPEFDLFIIFFPSTNS